MSKLANNLDHLSLAKRVAEVVKTFGKLSKTESLDDCCYGLSTKVNYRLQR